MKDFFALIFLLNFKEMWEVVILYVIFTVNQLRLPYFSVAFHIETCHLICCTNQISGFCMIFSAGLKLVKSLVEIDLAKFNHIDANLIDCFKTKSH